MRTTDLLQTVYGDAYNGFSTRLADIADTLVAEADAREARRMAEGEARELVAGAGQHLDLLASSLREAQAQALTDSRLPAVLAFDAYCVMKDASKADSSDRGLKQASHALYDRWNQDPMGHLTVGELATYRDHFINLHPRSAAKKVFDEDIPAVGFQTLTNLHGLTRIASTVVDQESYEQAMEAHGLDGDRPEQIRARAYIKGLVEFALDDQAFRPMEAPSAKGAFERATERVAQALFDDVDEMDVGDGELDEGLDEGLDGDTPEDAVYDPSEAELPHDERSEEMAEVMSPVTGEPLVVELGIADDRGVDGMEPEMDDAGAAPMGGALPQMFEPKASRARVAGHDDGYEDEYGDDEEEECPHCGSSDLSSESGEKMCASCGVQVEHYDHKRKPKASRARNAQMLPQEDQFDDVEEDFEPDNAMDVEPDMGGDAFGGDAMPAGSMGGSEPTVTMVVDPTSGEELELTLRRVQDEVPEPTFEEGMEDMASEMDEMGADSPEEDEDPMGVQAGLEEAMSVKVPTQPGAPKGSKFSDKSMSVKKKQKSKKAQRLSVEQVRHVCASMGLTSEAIEEALLDGREIAAGSYAVRIGPEDEVELRRLAKANTTEGAVVVRAASLADFDGLVSDFMALTAAQFATETTFERAAAKKQPEKTASYLVTSDVPQGAPINARRMMASVWKILPDAEGELLDNGRLSVLVRTAAERDINRIQRVFIDTYGVRNIQAQQIQAPQQAPSAANTAAQPSTAAQVMPQPANLQRTPVDSPYVGAGPVAPTPAGQPSPAMQQPQQLAATGSGAQADFIARHTDPLKQARRAQLAPMANPPKPPMGGPGGPGAAGPSAGPDSSLPPPTGPSALDSELDEDLDAAPMDEMGGDLDGPMDDVDLDVAPMGEDEGGDGTSAGDMSELIEAAVDLGVPQDLAQEIIDESPEEIAHRVRVNGLDEAAEEVRWRALHREAQLADPSMGGDPSMGDPSMGGAQMGADPMMGGAMGDPSMGDPSMSGMDGGMGAGDASQMPLDMSAGQLAPEEEDAVRGAMMHFRNMGMGPLEAIDKFTSAYGAMLDKYGDPSNPQRALAEAAVLRLMTEAFQRPAVVPAKSKAASANGRTAEMPHPKPTVQQKSKMKVNKTWTKGDVPEPSTPPSSHGSPPGFFSNKKMNVGKPTGNSSHSFGGDKKPGGPQKGSRAKQPGVVHPPTDIVPGTDGSGSGDFDSRMEALSGGANGAGGAKKKKGDLVISFDPELGDFHLMRGEKRLAIHASMNEALADAERRQMGTDARILILDVDGGLEEV